MLAHLDGTIHPDVPTFCHQGIYSLADVASGLNVEQPLGISRLSVGSGALMGHKMMKFVSE